MPHSEIHKKKLKKNLIIGLMVFLWCALIWGVTMIRIAKADEMPTSTAPQSDAVMVGRMPTDMKGAFYPGRDGHQEDILGRKEGWDDQYQEDSSDREAALTEDKQRRMKQLDAISDRKDGWDKTYYDHGEDMLAEEHEMQERRSAWRESVTSQPERWWAAWSEKQQEKSE